MGRVRTTAYRVLPTALCVAFAVAPMLCPPLGEATPTLVFEVFEGILEEPPPLSSSASGLNVTSVLGIDTPLNNGHTFGCGFPCTLSYTMGPQLTSSTQTSPQGSQTMSTFGEGGSITITGIVDGSLVTLMDGSFLSSTLVTSFEQTPPCFPPGCVIITSATQQVGGSFVDAKNVLLTDFFGLPAGPYTGSLQLQHRDVQAHVVGCCTEFTLFTAGSVSNIATPEPSTWLLLGSGLAGLRAWRRKGSGPRCQAFPVEQTPRGAGIRA
jgi:PEP-CTERM motif